MSGCPIRGSTSGGGPVCESAPEAAPGPKRRAPERAAAGDRPPEPSRPPSRRAARFAVQNRQRGRPVDRGGLVGFLEQVAEEVAPGDRRGATLRIVSDRTIHRLNHRYRQTDRPTDVLAFPADPHPGEEPPYLGDLVISAEMAARQAESRGRTLDCELRALAVHGLLHLFGYDHERDRGEMARLERLLRLRHGLPEAGESG